MNGIIYLVGLVVVIGVILSFLGLRYACEANDCINQGHVQQPHGPFSLSGSAIRNPTRSTGAYGCSAFGA